MGRKIVGGIVGVVVAVAVVIAARLLGHLIFPASGPEFGYQATEVLSWFLGALAGMFVALWMTGGSRRAAVIVAGVMLAVITLSLFQVNYPAWMVGCGLLLPVLAAFLATRIIPFERG